MSKRNQPEGEAAGGGGPSSDHGGRGGNRGGYNNGHGNYYGNWGNTPSYPMPYPNYPPTPYGQQPPPAFGSGYPFGQYPTYPPTGPGYNSYHFTPDAPWQPGNEPSNPFSQSHQASQTQQSQNNGRQQGGKRKKPKKSHEVEKASLCRVESDKGTAAPETPNVPKGGGTQQKPHRELHYQGNHDEETGVCGNCKKPGHEVIQCWAIGKDGFTHGCAVCNSGEHETDRCQRFPKEVNQKIEILVKRRACLPPLKTAFWYNLMWKWVKNNPTTEVSHLFPWTTQFAIDVLNGDRKSEVEGILATMRNNPDMERSQLIIDPATANWEKVKETYGGDPKNFFEKLRAAKGAVSKQRIANAIVQEQQSHAYVASEKEESRHSDPRMSDDEVAGFEQGDGDGDQHLASKSASPIAQRTSPAKEPLTQTGVEEANDDEMQGDESSPLKATPVGSFSTAATESDEGEEDSYVQVRTWQLGAAHNALWPPRRRGGR
ncbi:uncharacterized protein FMAN_05495 [Fusarium mangiferae]|uniref:Uncharacterized protein n=1 Tax=Fusarium mangiferae TaxID=192010 RepID=A0A1L7SST8_FUSMA|nr:uncharacterized protein FMAN_05495 [Fusarium mangiferae]CVK87552.1 uncharacterized protein FMAN_05495 [Fusarium mangiferae]